MITFGRKNGIIWLRTEVAEMPTLTVIQPKVEDDTHRLLRVYAVNVVQLVDAAAGLPTTGTGRCGGALTASNMVRYTVNHLLLTKNRFITLL